MGRSLRSIRLTVAALALGLASVGIATRLPALPTADAAPRAPAPCAFHGARTAARSVHARILSLPHRSAVYGCWFRNGRLVRLTAKYHEIGLDFHLNGRWVAFAVWQRGVGQGIRVVDLKQGRRLATYRHVGESPQQLEVTPTGAVAWIATAPSPQSYIVRGASRDGERLLDPGPGVHRRGLAIATPANEPAIVYWTRDGAARSALL